MTSPDLIDPSELFASAEARLLLTTAKPFQNLEQLEEIRPLVQRITDWQFVTDTAIRKFSAPYLYRALTGVAPSIAPPRAVSRLNEHKKLTNFRLLKVAAAQIAFHKTCIEPIHARHAYLKGIALSLQFNGNYVDRFCRDVDVLVDKNQIEQVILAAVDNGYRVVLTEHPLSFAETHDDLKFLTKFASDVGVISPDGVLIEVHRRLDKKDYIFEVEDALSSTESIVLSNVKMQTLKAPLHFAYACYHHSRHLWSHLHWIADLDLMLRSGKIDRKQVSRSAHTIGILPTTDASIELHDILSNVGRQFDQRVSSDLAIEFLQACLFNLNGGKELEYQLREDSFGHDLMSKAQISPERLKRAQNTVWKNKFHPALEQYLKRPLPAALFWLYRVQRAIVVARDSLKSVFTQDSRNRVKDASHSTTDKSGDEHEAT